MKGSLGKGTPKDYKACCLGELLCVVARADKKKLPFVDGRILASDRSDYSLDTFTTKKLGLRDSVGSILNNKPSIRTLASMNDKGKTWIEIAQYIRQNPHLIFTKTA